jgi:hypothetical protein
MKTNPADKGEENVVAEIYPNVAAVASVYGDADGTYGKFLNASGFPYADDATFLWDQPLAGGHVSVANSSSSGDPDKPTGTGGAVRLEWVGRAFLVPSILLVLGLHFW